MDATEFHSIARLSDQESARHCGMATGPFITAMKDPAAPKPTLFRDRRWWPVDELTGWLAALGKKPVDRKDWPEPEEAIHTKIETRQSFEIGANR